MKILYIKNGMHPKNNHALNNYKNIDLQIIEDIHLLEQLDLTQFDCVYSPCIPIQANKYPNTKFIFGPHFSVFPEKQHMDIIKGQNVIYLQPSDWARDVWKYNPLCQNIRIETLPFGVDINKFNEIKPIHQRNEVFIYVKRRNPIDINKLLDFLHVKGITPKIFNYTSRYNEEDYLNCLQNSCYGI